MTITRSLSALAVGILLAGAAGAQQHQHSGMTMPDHGMTMSVKDYDDPGGGSGGGDPTPPAGCVGAQNVVRISGESFSPSGITIQAGQAVCWTWDTGLSHTVTADDGSFNSGSPMPAGTFQVTFPNAGTFGYYCIVHGSKTGGMRGTITVTGTTGGGDGGGGTDDGPGKIQLSASAYSVVEGSSVTTPGAARKKPASGGKVTITVRRVGGSHGAASVQVKETKGSAKPGTDFLIPKTTVLKWTDGDDDPRNIDIPLVNDKTPEKDETFTVSLSKATGATMGSPSKAKVTIKDDDHRRKAVAPEALRAAGSSPGDVELSWGAGSARGNALHVERRAIEGGEFEDVATLGIDATSFVDHGLPLDSTFLYRVRAEGPDGETDLSVLAAAATDGPRGGCDDGTLCLGGRFEATALWRAAPGEPAHPAARMALVDRPGAGLLALRSGDDPQLLLEVRDGCATNGHYWVTLGGATDVELLVRVRDTATGRTWVRYVADGDDASIRDFDAFATCP